MAKPILSLVLLVLLNVAYSSAKDWCSVRCAIAGPHPLCGYRPNVYGPQCGKIVKRGLTPVEKREILNLHNSLRQKVASGRETRGRPGPQPRARNMQNLAWDNELALIAQAWANQCEFKHSCSDVDRFHVGQNIGYNSDTKLELIVNSWYNEVESFNKAGVTDMNIRWNSGLVSHYTQMVWAETNKIGCGAVIYDRDRDGFNRLHLVCNYGPTGNWGKVMYQI